MNRRLFTPTQFAYWLQGVFEIGEIDALTKDQAMIIRRRLNDVKDKQPYIVLLWAVLATQSLSVATSELRKLQNNIFVHDIDPSYEGDQEFFHDLHTGVKQVL